MMNDMPKLESPFVREMIRGQYVVTPKIQDGYEWVFEDDDVMAVEKLDGTNVSIFMSNGNLVAINNRANSIECGALVTNRFIEGVRLAYQKGKVPLSDGQHFGELMGPKIQKNFLKLDAPFWFSFDYLKDNFSYKSFHNYPKTFENISDWFKDGLFSLVYSKYKGEKFPPEGIVFTHRDGRMAKLRRDMFDWYKGPRHKH